MFIKKIFEGFLLNNKNSFGPMVLKKIIFKILHHYLVVDL